MTTEEESGGASGIVRARRLRKSMTEAEKRLWQTLRSRQLGGNFGCARFGF